jgi:hypothetical protein
MERVSLWPRAAMWAVAVSTEPRLDEIVQSVNHRYISAIERGEVCAMNQ